MTVLTPTNGGAGGGSTYDPFTYVDPSAVDQDNNPVAPGTMYSVPPTTDFTGAIHTAANLDGPIDATSAPVISTISPSPAALVTGAYGTLEGHGFFGHVQALTFRLKSNTTSGYSTLVVPFTVEDDNVIIFGPIPAYTPSGTGGGGLITFKNHRGTAYLPLCDPSTISGFTPNHGSVGARIHIDGNFGGTIDDVVFAGGAHGGNPQMGDGGVYVTVPTGALTGPVCCYASACSGANVCSDGAMPFTVDGAPAEAPFISGFQPDSGPSGTHVTIFGQGFNNAYKVTIAGQNMASFTVQDDANITCIIPTGAVSGHLKVYGPGGTAQSATWFTVGVNNDTVPIIDKLTPNPCPQGVQLTIYGSGFNNLSPQGGVKYISGNSTFFLNGHWTVHNGGTMIVVDAAGTYSLPGDTSGKIHIENVAGKYDEKALTISKFNPKIVASAKAPYFNVGTGLIIAPGAVISTSPPADVVDLPGWLGITAVAGMAAADLLGNSYRNDHFTNPPGSFTTPAKTVKGTAMPKPYPYNRTNAGTATAHWNTFGKVISLDKFRVEKANIMARSIPNENYLEQDCVSILVVGPLWNEARTEVQGNWKIYVNDARCNIVTALVVWKLMLGGAVMATGNEVITPAGDGPACAKSIYGDAWHEALPGAPGNVWTFGVTAEVDYYNAAGQYRVWTCPPETRGGLNCGDANALVTVPGGTLYGC